MNENKPATTDVIRRMWQADAVVRGIAAAYYREAMAVLLPKLYAVSAANLPQPKKEGR